MAVRFGGKWLYFHMPKTGGTWMRNVAAREVPPSEKVGTPHGGIREFGEFALKGNLLERLREVRRWT